MSFASRNGRRPFLTDWIPTKTPATLTCREKSFFRSVTFVDVIGPFVKKGLDGPGGNSSSCSIFLCWVGPDPHIDSTVAWITANRQKPHDKFNPVLSLIRDHDDLCVDPVFDPERRQWPSSSFMSGWKQKKTKSPRECVTFYRGLT